jgi:hypothetical protein
MGSSRLLPPPQEGPPNWVWVIALRDHGAAVIEGGAVGSDTVPQRLRPVLAWLASRVDGLSEQDGGR